MLLRQLMPMPRYAFDATMLLLPLLSLATLTLLIAHTHITMLIRYAMMPLPAAMPRADDCRRVFAATRCRAALRADISPLFRLCFTLRYAAYASFR